MLLEDVFVSADVSSDIFVIARLASQNVKAIEKGAEAKTNIIVIRGLVPSRLSSHNPPNIDPKTMISVRQPTSPPTTMAFELKATCQGETFDGSFVGLFTRELYHKP